MTEWTCIGAWKKRSQFRVVISDNLLKKNKKNFKYHLGCFVGHIIKTKCSTQVLPVWTWWEDHVRKNCSPQSLKPFPSHMGTPRVESSNCPGPASFNNKRYALCRERTRTLRATGMQHRVRSRRVIIWVPLKLSKALGGLWSPLMPRSQEMNHTPWFCAASLPHTHTRANKLNNFRLSEMKVICFIAHEPISWCVSACRSLSMNLQHFSDREIPCCVKWFDDSPNQSRPNRNHRYAYPTN